MSSAPPVSRSPLSGSACTLPAASGLSAPLHSPSLRLSFLPFVLPAFLSVPHPHTFRWFGLKKYSEVSKTKTRGFVVVLVVVFSVPPSLPSHPPKKNNSRNESPFPSPSDSSKTSAPKSSARAAERQREGKASSGELEAMGGGTQVRVRASTGWFVVAGPSGRGIGKGRRQGRLREGPRGQRNPRAAFYCSRARAAEREAGESAAGEAAPSPPPPLRTFRASRGHEARPRPAVKRARRSPPTSWRARQCGPAAPSLLLFSPPFPPCLPAPLPARPGRAPARRFAASL